MTRIRMYRVLVMALYITNFPEANSPPPRTNEGPQTAFDSDMRWPKEMEMAYSIN